jgi:curli biogenesis system outer membrane secretion channel CsgG
MKKDSILIFLVFTLLMGIMGACAVLRAAYGIPEPQESEASIRRKITSAVDKASAEIILSLSKGVKLAVIGGSSSGNDQEMVVAYFKSQGHSDSEARTIVQQMGKQQVSVLAGQIKGLGVSSPGNSYADYAVEDLEYTMVKGGFRLVDRQQIEKIRSEQQFQLSGEVDDNSAVSIGKMAGANAVIIISVNYVDGSGRLTLKALDVQTAEIITMARQEF